MTQIFHFSHHYTPKTPKNSQIFLHKFCIVNKRFQNGLEDVSNFFPLVDSFLPCMLYYLPSWES